MLWMPARRHGVPAAIQRWRRGPEQLLLPAVLAALPDHELDPDDRVVMIDLRRRAWAESEALWANFENFVDLVNPAGWTPIVVKGGARRSDLHEHQGLGSSPMSMCWCHRIASTRCSTSLVDHGWRIGSHIDPWSHAVTLVAPDERLLDLHRWVVFPRYCELPEHGWLDRATTVVERGRTVGCLARADEMVLAIVHGLSSRGVSRQPLAARRRRDHPLRRRRPRRALGCSDPFGRRSRIVIAGRSWPRPVPHDARDADLRRCCRAAPRRCVAPPAPSSGHAPSPQQPTGAVDAVSTSGAQQRAASQTVGVRRGPAPPPQALEHSGRFAAACSALRCEWPTAVGVDVTRCQSLRDARSVSTCARIQP